MTSHRPALSISRSVRPRTGAIAGLSLVELLVVIAVIGIIAAIALPSVTKVTDGAAVSATAADLKNFETAYVAYRSLEGAWPPDSVVATLPDSATMQKYLSAAQFQKTTPLGGNYNWEGPSYHPFAAISVDGATASTALLTRLDSILDDGNPATGYFRRTINGRYTYILEWK
jgi:prepilin-type N-terminal cleavage/methylation domain-containing protein